jgi:hypothetical protein
MNKARAAFEARCARVREETEPPEGPGGILAELDRRCREEVAQAERDHGESVAAIESRHKAEVDEVADRWRRGVGKVVAAVAAIREAVDRVNPPWDDPSWRAWSPPAAPPPAVRFGEVRFGLDRIPQGVPRDEGMAACLPGELAWPALLHFPERASLLVTAPAAGRGAAIRVVQSVLMRLMTSVPPGQVRVTIIDPVNLGGDFGTLLHLADYKGLLDPIWTDSPQIAQSLGDVCGHMEKIIQSYLRDDHPTIVEFNALAGEVAEPFRILVICDFPAGFDQASCLRLARVAARGAKCGVLTLIVADPSQPIPPGVTLRDLAAQAVHLDWRGGRLCWNDPDFGDFPLEPDPPPPAALAKQVLRRVGAASEASRRVEVPFEFVAPPPERWWAADGRAGIEVGLGKAGPTEAKALALGRGTSQHVLIAGRTGSGKSSLLHALITNVALHYSPDEVELYLIDFKKGVEFKVYATHELPHARVVAIESEREFGLSVLQRLDAELKDRGERFRAAGVQDLKGYREIAGLPPLPRILLIVDEFQEFFVEDDRIAHDVALLLDRLVRQGRAFGIHVLLGSQTLSGAYSLARSTLGQMAVRVALQCGETDAHLILSEENGAARLLSRPGEAIYNDANGLVEGNHFFQVVWLPEDRREEYLGRVRDLARRRGWQPPRPQVVFEGDAASDLSRNAQLQALLSAPSWPAAPRAATAWLGESVSIKDPTAARFCRQPWDHLLVVGQEGEAAVGVLAAALLSLAAQYPPAGPLAARFSILDGSLAEAPWAGALALVADALPHAVAAGGRHDVGPVLAELAREVERRLEVGAAAGPDLFLLLCDAGRFRELRRSDDYDFGAARDPSRPPAALEAILRDGASVGVYVLAWCDGVNGVNRTFSREARRAFGSKVAFQMRESDSSLLLDTPQAGRLGHHRALFVDEDQGVEEKFRPYELPSRDWLARVRGRFRARALAAAPAPAPDQTPAEHPGRCE